MKVCPAMCCILLVTLLLLLGQVEKQDTSGNECEHEREYESEAVDHIMVVSMCLFLRTTLKGWTNTDFS